MSRDPRFLVASRIHLLLRRELGHVIDVPRLLQEPLYARDVLLVCDALAGTELPVLSKQFRDAGQAMEAAERSLRAKPLPTPAPEPARKGWFSPSHWLRG